MAKKRRPWGAMLRRRMGSRPVLSMLNHHPVVVTLAVAGLIAWSIVQILEWKLRPVVAHIAETQVSNTMTAVIELAVTEDLAKRNISYGDLVTIQRDNTGAITALTTNMAQINLLRAELTAAILEALEGVDVSTIQVPLGSLLDFEPLWARGPALQARAMTVGTVSAEFESEFSSAGVNQTLHRIWMDVTVPMTVLLPGGELQVKVQTSLPVAETVVVGQVPNTYLSLDGAHANS